MAGILYDNLDLRFEAPGAGSGGAYQVFLTSSVGEATGDFSPPTTLGASVTGPAGVARHARPAGGNEADVHAPGKTLFDALFTGDLLVSLHEALNESARTERGLRIRLHLRGAPALADLPWEQLFSTRLARFLALSTRTPIVRYLDLPSAPRPIDSAPPLRMLVVIASPKDLPGLKGDEEWTRLETALSPLIDAGRVIMERVPEATLDGLRARLQQQVFHALHFIGHGDFDTDAQEGALAFDDAEGRAHRVGAEALALLLHDHPSLRLVVLNACESSRAGTGDAFAGTAQRLAQQGVPAVIAMTRPVSDAAAIVFAEELYGLLAAGFPVDAALSEARRWLFLKDFRTEWATPTLHLRTDDGQLFGPPEDWTPTWGAEKDDGSPFPGLSFFDEDQRAYFFGRESEIDEARGLLGGAAPHRRWLQIDGPSGAGKSSFARAGLVPAVRARGVIGGPKEWIVALMRPGPDPIASLARALRTALPGMEKDSSDVVEERLRARPMALRGTLADHAGPRGVLLVVDQLEEVFTLASGDAGAVKQLDALLDGALGDGDGKLYLVTTVRSDFTGKMGELPLLEKRLSTEAGRYYLRAMGQDGMRRAIEEPAKRAGLAWSVGLPARILGDASKSVGALPLVAHVLFAVWSARSGRVLSASAYDALGGVGGALAKSADGIVAALGEEGGRRARRLLLRLVKIGRGSEDTRQTATWEEVIAAAGGGKEAEKVLARLSGGRDPEVPAIATMAVPRLVVVSRGAQGERVDLVHEALIQRWETLQKWIEEERRALELRDDVEQAARVWEANGADPGSLPKGRMLTRFRGVARAGLHEGAESFLRAAEEGEKREEEEKRDLAARDQRRVRRTIEATAAAAVVFAVLAGGLFWQFKKAKEAVRVGQGRLASARADQPGREMESLQMGIDAVAGGGTDPSAAPPAAVEGMVRGLMPVRQFITLQSEAGHVTTAAFSSDGTRLVTANADTSAWLWDARSGELVTVLQGHTRAVNKAAFSPDSSCVVTASEDATARLWDAKDGTPRAVLNLHTDAVLSVAFSRDSARLLTASRDQTARIWDARDGTPLPVLRGHTNTVWTVAFSLDGARVVTAGTDKTARIWDASDGKPLLTLPGRTDIQGHTDTVRSAAFSPDGTRVVTASEDSTGKLWDAKTGDLVGPLTGHTLGLKSASFSPDGARILTASDDGTARLWDANEGAAVAVLEGHTNTVWSAAFSPDGLRVLTASGDGTMRLWDSTEGRSLAVFRGHKAGISAAAFSPDGGQVVTGSADGTARLWDARESKPLVILQKHPDQVLALAFSPRTSYFVTGSLDGTTRIWAVNENKLISTLAGHPDRPDVVFSPDLTRVLTRSSKDLLQVWNTSSGNLLTTVRDLTWKGGSSVTFSPDGNRILTVSDDRAAHLWSADDGKLIVSLRGHEATVTSAHFSPDGTKVVTTSFDHTARLWSASTGVELLVLRGHTEGVEHAVFSPLGERVATGSDDKTTRLWDTRTGTLIVTLVGSTSSVSGVAFSPDGERVATTDTDSTLRLWGAKNGNLLSTFHAGKYVSGPVFSPDGTRVAAAGDTTSFLLDVETGQQLAVLPGHLKDVFAVAFSPDGRHLATTSQDGTVRIWAATPEGFLIQACQYLHPWPAFEAVKNECTPYLGRTP